MQTVLIGEIGLSGEIRPVNNLEKRIYEAQKLGFKRAIIPDANNCNEEFESIKLVKVKRIIDAISCAMISLVP